MMLLCWVVNKQLRLITEPMFEFSRSARRQVEFDTQTGPKPLKNLNSHNCVQGARACGGWGLLEATYSVCLFPRAFVSRKAGDLPKLTDRT